MGSTVTTDALRSVGLAFLGVAFGAGCSAVPSLTFVGEDASVGVLDGAPPTDGAAGGSIDASGSSSKDSGSGTDAGTGADAGTDAGPTGCPASPPPGDVCCGAIACVGNQCATGPTCSMCTTQCAGSSFCCPQGFGPIRCANDAAACK